MATAPGYAACSYELRHSLVSRTAFITFGIDAVGTDPATVATQVLGAFTAAGSLFAAIDNNVTLIATRVSLGTDGGEDLQAVNATTWACTNNLPGYPPNVAVLVHKRSARGGRRGRGRIYLPWALSTSDVSEAGIIGGTRITAITNAVNAWTTHLSSNAGPMVILHRPSKPGIPHPSAEGPPNVVTATNVDTLVGTQRRRLGRA